MRLVLGSSSRWRRQLLAKTGVEFTTSSPDIDERSIRHDDPEALVCALAQAKLEALLMRVTEPSVIIASDQVTLLNGEICEKPRDAAEAREMMRRSSDEPSATVTAVAVANTATGARAHGIDTVRIWIKPLPDDLIERLIEQGDVMGCSGALSIEEPLLQPHVARVDGALDSVIGLPLALTRKLVESVGGPIIPVPKFSEQPLVRALCALGLPVADFAVFGSGPLMARGLRDSADFDVVARGAAWRRALELGQPEAAGSGGQKISLSGNIDVFDSWGPGEWDVDALINEADVIADIRFVRLAEVRRWKERLGRDKDQRDLTLIDSYVNP